MCCDEVRGSGKRREEPFSSLETQEGLLRGHLSQYFEFLFSLNGREREISHDCSILVIKSKLAAPFPWL